MNRRVKFDVASFLLGREIRNRTKTQKITKKNKQTVNDISTLCLSACKDNEYTQLWQYHGVVISNVVESGYLIVLDHGQYTSTPGDIETSTVTSAAAVLVVIRSFLHSW